MKSLSTSLVRRIISTVDTKTPSNVTIQLRDVSGRMGRRDGPRRLGVPPSNRVGTTCTIATSSAACTDRNFRLLSGSGRGQLAAPLTVTRWPDAYTSVRTNLRGVPTRRDADRSDRELSPSDFLTTRLSIVRVPLDIAVAPLSVLRRRFDEGDRRNVPKHQGELLKVPSNGFIKAASSRDRRNLRTATILTGPLLADQLRWVASKNRFILNKHRPPRTADVSKKPSQLKELKQSLKRKENKTDVETTKIPSSDKKRLQLKTQGLKPVKSILKEDSSLASPSKIKKTSKSVSIAENLTSSEKTRSEKDHPNPKKCQPPTKSKKGVKPPLKSTRKSKILSKKVEKKIVDPEPTIIGRFSYSC